MEKQVLVLGAGYVSAPLVEYLSRYKDINLVVASAIQAEADSIARQFDSVEPVLLDIIHRPDLLKDLVKNSDVVVSLLPYSLHPQVAEECIQSGTNLVTASYCSPAMMALDEAAKQAGITVVNEVGLDPGIDHLLAMECFDEVKRGGGKILSFISYCGGLPAPESSDNPLRYKFSWSPKGVLMNTLGGAKYLQDGQVIEIPSGGALLESATKQEFLPAFALEGFANRDSTQYAKFYGIDAAQTVLRGTLRFTGFCENVKGMQMLGLLNPQNHPILHESGPEITWRQLVCELSGIMDDNLFYENFKKQVYERVGFNRKRIDAIETLGLLSDDPVAKRGSPLDTLSHYLSKRLSLGKGDRDLVILRHEIVIQWPDGKREKRGINLVNYGDSNGYSAMAKTVGYPAAIATKMVLDGEIQTKGMVLPLTEDIYSPMLKRLRSEGINASEKSEIL